LTIKIAQIAQDSDSSISDELREVQLKLQLNEQHSQSSISLLRQENEELKREREAAMLKTSQLQYELTATKSKLANAMDISQRWEMEKHRMQQEIQQLREDIGTSRRVRALKTSADSLNKRCVYVLSKRVPRRSQKVARI
jgi:chromosome segregation ATPase